jgi:drug/metabolite transporter (DMT)-like permease
MLRGTLVLFAGAFTVVILRRRLFSHHWLGMVLITAGAALVGASSIIYSSHDAAGDAGPSLLAALRAALGGGGGRSDGAGGGVAAAPLFGDILVVCAQAFNALQFILEEKFLTQYKVPALLAVGIEGLWGLALCLVAMPIASFARGRDGVVIDDAAAAVRQIAGHGELAAAVALSVFSIACFNFFGAHGAKPSRGRPGLLQTCLYRLSPRAAAAACPLLIVFSPPPAAPPAALPPPKASP